MAVVLILGLLLVTYSRSQRDVSALAPTLRDHWHSAYSIWDCESESYAPTLTSDFDPRGIHSHQDSLLHIHPFSSAVTGDGATLGVFFEAMLVDLDDGQLTLPDGTVLKEGTMCGGEEAVLQVVRYNANDMGAGPVETIIGDVGDVILEGNREAFVIALAPVGAEIPPPTAESLANLDGASPERLSEAPNTVVPTDLGEIEDEGDDSDADTESEDTESEESPTTTEAP